MQERILIRRLKQHQPQALEELIKTYSPYVGTIVAILSESICQNQMWRNSLRMFFWQCGNTPTS